MKLLYNLTMTKLTNIIHFYGRGNRYLNIIEKTQKKTLKFNEKNSFSNLFNVREKTWKITQHIRNKLMLKNLSSLEKLNNQYNKISKN